MHIQQGLNGNRQPSHVNEFQLKRVGWYVNRFSLFNRASPGRNKLDYVSFMGVKSGCYTADLHLLRA